VFWLMGSALSLFISVYPAVPPFLQLPWSYMYRPVERCSKTICLCLAGCTASSGSFSSLECGLSISESPLFSRKQIRLYRVKWFFSFLEYNLNISLLWVTMARNLTVRDVRDS
jgi:hypothetical protein